MKSRAALSYPALEGRKSGSRLMLCSRGHFGSGLILTPMRGRRRCLGFMQQQARARKYPAAAGNSKAAKAVPRKAMKGQPAPAKVTLDANAASHRAVADRKNNGEVPKRARVRGSQYLNKKDPVPIEADVGAEERRDGGAGWANGKIGQDRGSPEFAREPACHECLRSFRTTA